MEIERVNPTYGQNAGAQSLTTCRVLFRALIQTRKIPQFLKCGFSLMHAILILEFNGKNTLNICSGCKQFYMLIRQISILKHHIFNTSFTIPISFRIYKYYNFTDFARIGLIAVWGSCVFLLNIFFDEFSQQIIVQ